MDEQITKSINKLIELGEDKAELNFWLHILPQLNNEEQKKLAEICDQEISALEGGGAKAVDIID